MKWYAPILGRAEEITESSVDLPTDGKPTSRTYDNQQGQRVYVTEVVADNFQLLESKAATESRAHADQSSTSPSTTTFEQRDTATPNNNGLNASQNPFGGQSIDISDDDLPF